MMQKLRSALLWGGILAGVFLPHFLQATPSSNFSASSLASPPERLTELLRAHDFVQLEQEVQGFEQSEAFLEDVKTCRYFDRVDVERLETGFWLRFECVAMGDVFHPYAAFFQLTPTKQIFWERS